MQFTADHGIVIQKSNKKKEKRKEIKGKR